MTATRLFDQLKIHRNFVIQFTALLVGLHGTFVLATTLLDQFSLRHGVRLTAITIDVPLLIGISLIYLSSLLMRRKRTAWVVVILVYVFLLGFSMMPLLEMLEQHRIDIDNWVRALVLPLLILTLLTILRTEFVVRSDIKAFRASFKFTVLILLVALLYGVAGFLLLDKPDFHRELTPAEAFHRTIDQFDLTTSHPLKPYTKRARLFLDSLSFVSTAAAAYAVISLFQPLRYRFGDQTVNRERMARLLEEHSAPSEDFFKLWPRDKHYYFNEAQSAGLAMRVHSGVALCLGDPAGDPKAIKGLIKDFEKQCYINDWLPAFIHAEPKHKKLYESFGYSLQKIGEEAVVDVKNFLDTVVRDKYFRNIRNRFERQTYTYELLMPPHNPAVLHRLQIVSNEWLERPGRTERGFAMGYYSEDYMQKCPLLVARDAAGTIQGFMNQLPATFDKEEANFDLLRHASGSPGNINDYLLVNFITLMKERGYKRVNLGLCPLVGLDDQDTDKTLLDNFLHFAYANGDRFYSFSGLHRFKSKYEPVWSDRYIVYKGGLRGFTRTANALMRVMRVKL